MRRAHRCSWRLGRRDEAIAAWQRAISLDPQNAEARAALERARTGRS
jgi:Tfp pilus assembly protein PilF